MLARVNKHHSQDWAIEPPNLNTIGLSCNCGLFDCLSEMPESLTIDGHRQRCDVRTIGIEQ
jgi:hypothetical protein